MPQNYANHASLPKVFFLVLWPIFTAEFVLRARTAWSDPSLSNIWATVVAIGLLVAIFFARSTAMKVQDRIIVAESLARLRALLPADLAGQLESLTRRQIIALRFASDDEVAPLVRRTLAGEFTSTSALKKAIGTWRPDLLPRV